MKKMGGEGGDSCFQRGIWECGRIICKCPCIYIYVHVEETWWWWGGVGDFE